MRHLAAYISDKTYLFWFDMEFGMPPLCGGTYGEWHHSDTLLELYNEFTDCLYDVISTLCQNKDYVSYDKSLLEILNEYEEDYDFDVKDIKSYNALKELLKDIYKVDSYDDFKDYSDKLFSLFNKLGINCNFYLYESPKEALELVKIHNANIEGDYNNIFLNDVMEG